MLLFNPLSLWKGPVEVLMEKMSGSTFRTKENVTNTGTELTVFEHMFRDLYSVTELLSNNGRMPDTAGGAWPGPAPGGWGTKAPPPNCWGQEMQSPGGCVLPLLAWGSAVMGQAVCPCQLR